MEDNLIQDMQHFNAIEDAKNLKHALINSLDMDGKCLIDILANRCNSQRQAIQTSYKAEFGVQLESHLQKYTKGNFAVLLFDLLTSTADYHIKQLHDATRSTNVDEEVLIEFLCGFSNIAIITLKDAYKIKYHREIENDIKTVTSGIFRQFLLLLCSGTRDENLPIDRESANSDAQAIIKNDEEKLEMDECILNIFCRKSYAQIAIINEEYENLSNHTLEETLSNHFSGYIKDGILAVLKCSINKSEYYATKLYDSMTKFGTNHKQLIRIIVSRSEFDLLNINQAFKFKYRDTLVNWISKNCTERFYKECLLAIIGYE